MSESLNLLLNFLIEEAFNKETAEIADFLFNNGASSLYEITKNIKKEFTAVRDCIIMLCQNRFVSVKKKEEINVVSSENIYEIDINMVLNILRHPRILNIINQKFGKISKDILEVFMLHGVLTCSQTLEIVESFLDIPSEKRNTLLNELRKEFLKLVMESVLVQIDSNIHDNKEMLYQENKISSLSKEKYLDNNMYQEQKTIEKNSDILNNTMKNSSKKKIPKTPKSNKKGFKDLDINNELHLNEDKKQKDVSVLPDIVPEDHFLLVYGEEEKNEIFYAINYDKLNTLIKTEFIFDYIAKSVSLQSAQAALMFMKATGYSILKDTKNKRETISFSCKELITSLKLTTSYYENKDKQQEYYDPVFLEEIIKKTKQEDASLFVSKNKDFYSLSLENTYFNIKNKLKERVVEQLLSPIHARIYRLISKSGPLDMKNIMDICMIPQKECSICLNQLIKTTFLEIQELNIKGSNQIFFKTVKDVKENSLKNMLYKTILNMKVLIKNKLAQNAYSASLLEDAIDTNTNKNDIRHRKQKESENTLQATKVLSVVSELDKYLMILE